MSENIKGITVTIGGDTTGLDAALKNINKETQTTQKELSQIEKLLKLDPTNVELLTQKQQLLSKQIETTGSKLQSLKDAQSRADEVMKNGGEVNQEQYRKLQREIVSTEQSLKVLEKSSKNNNEELQKVEKDGGSAFSKLKNKVDEAKESLSDAKEKLNGVKDVLTGVGKVVASVGAAAVSAGASAAAAMGTMAVKAGASADDINTLSAQTGLATDQIQMFQYASDTIDVSLDTLTGSMSKLTKNMATASKGSGDAYNAFNSLGVSITNADGSLRNNQDVFNDCILALGQMENETQRDALAMQIFGKSAQELNPLIKGGADTLSKMGAQAKNLGIILSQDTLDKANAFNDELDLLKANASGAFKALGSEIAGGLTPYMEELNLVSMEAIQNLMGAFQEGGFEGLISEFGVVFSEIINKISEYIPQIIDLGVKVLEALIKGIVDNLGSITSSAVTIITILTTKILEMLPELLKMGIQILVELINGIAQALPDLIPVIVECIVLIVDTLLNNLDMLVDAAIQIILALVKGLIDALPRLIERIPEILISLVNAIIENAPLLLDAALQLIVMLGQGLIDSLPSLANAIKEIVLWIVDSFDNLMSKISNVGKNIIQGLWNGMKNAKDWLISKIKELCRNALDAIKNFFGIASPSKVMRDEVGKYMAEGIGVGFTKTMSSVIDDMKSKLDLATNTMSSELNISGVPELKGNNIVSENKYITKNYSNTTEVVRQPSSVVLEIDKQILGRVVVPAYNEENVRLGVKLVGND